MYLAKLIILLKALSMSLSHETKSEILLRNEQELLSSISNDPVLVKPEPKLKTPKKFSSTSNAKVASMRNNTSLKLTNYLEHIKKRGVKTLNYIAKDVLKDVDQEIVNRKINATCDIYTTKMQNYYNYISGPNGIAVFSREFILLDICEVACRILYHQQIKMLTDIIATEYVTNIDDDKEYSASNEAINLVAGHFHQNHIKNITETINQFNIDLRTKEMKYICKKYNVCRPYPGFTDYCGYFIHEILKLPSRKFHVITRLLIMILKINEDVMRLTSEITNYETFINKIDLISKNDTMKKESFEMLKAVLSQKFSIVRNPYVNFKMRASAIRILLDIIDRSFTGKEHDEFILNFDKTIAAIRKWATDEIPSISGDLEKFTDKILKMLNMILYSVKTDRKHIYILIHMIKTGTSNQYIQNYAQNQ